MRWHRSAKGILSSIKHEPLNYFKDCYTLEEIKERYRTKAKILHPDKGGDPAKFRDLQEQYESIEPRIQKEEKLPPYFHVNSNYTYHRVKVTYFQRDNHWYKFHKDYGADVWIDVHHMWLIKEEVKAVIF